MFSLFKQHAWLERRGIFLVLAVLATISVGGIVEIVPLFTIETTVERVAGMRPYTPLELAGRNIYLREGCYNCHSQMIRPFRDEIERYGHFSLAAESMYDHPFQWGSKRTGPDLARVGGKYSNEWHVAHLVEPAALVPGTVMPPYRHLLRPLEPGDVAGHLRANLAVGVPYTDEMLAEARVDLVTQADPLADHSGLLARYPRAWVGDLDGSPRVLTEMDALVAYLQILGRMVDMDAVAPAQLRQ